MEAKSMYFLSGEELDIRLRTVFNEVLNEREKKQAVSEYTKNQVAKKVGLSWATVDKLVKEGQLKTTGTGRITEISLREFLDQQ